ncbi:MAG: zf-HC2 domain-containing protein [Erysipelotrichaceae bacterium]
MKRYDCDIVKDLLPLYVDGVVSENTKQFIETHVKECSICQSELELLQRELSKNQENKPLQNKGNFILKIKRRIHRMYALMIMITIALVCMLSYLGTSYLKNTYNTVTFKNNIEVEMENGNLVAEVNGTSIVHSHIVNIPINEEETEFYSFFYVESSLWDDMISSDSTLSKITISYNEKGSENISNVYYYTGDYKDISLMTVSELEDIILKSNLLWSKE